MSHACQRDLGRRLLTSSLTPDEETRLVEHLDHCDQCRSWLEQDAGDAETWHEARALLSTAGDETVGLAPEENRPPHASVRAALDLLAPTDDPSMLGRIGPYEVFGVVGHGGMGVVFKAFDKTLDRVAAIKVIDPLLAKVGAARRRFAGEAKAMAAVFHENVVPVHAVNVHDGLPYFVMEYVPGCSLERRIADDGPLEIVDVVRIALQVAKALAEAHRQGLIHRDIKPGNILLEQGVERVFVTDFGLARVIDDASMTQSGLLAGTPQYMSPEQVKGATAATTSDLFSLGSVMYAMCTGHPPFRADSVYGVMHRIAHDTPRRLNEANPRAPSWLDALVGRLLAKDADQRFATADEVAEILWAELAYLQNPSSTPKPARDWLPARRRKRMVSAAIVGLVAIVASAGIAASAWRGGNENGPVAAGSSQVAGEDWPGQPVGATQRSAPQANGVSSDPIDPNQETLDSEPENVWNNADLVGANQQADRLEAEWRSSTSQSTDLWQVELSRASALAAALEEQEQSEPTP